MILFNPMTLFMVLFLVFGIRSVKKKRIISATVHLILFACLAFNTVLLFLRVEQSSRLSEEQARREAEANGSSNQLLHGTAGSRADAAPSVP